MMKERTRGVVTYFKCVEYVRLKCRARIHATPDGVICERVNVHCHPPDENDAEVRYAVVI